MRPLIRAKTQSAILTTRGRTPFLKPRVTFSVASTSVIIEERGDKVFSTKKQEKLNAKGGKYE
jgi:hypothetical protein